MQKGFLYIVPELGNGSATIHLSAPSNEGTDRQIELLVQAENVDSKTVIVTQLGMRDAYTCNGDAFVCSDGQFNVLK